jgi:hypothetical protein
MKANSNKDPEQQQKVVLIVPGMGSLPPYLIGLLGFVYPMISFIEMAATGCGAGGGGRYHQGGFKSCHNRAA